MTRSSQTETIPWARPDVGDAELAEVVATMNGGWLTAGPRVRQFEAVMAARAGRKFGVAVSNGTAALELAVQALDIGRGHGVIVPAMSYIATAAAVAVLGATPVFCDVDEISLGLDAARAADRIAPNTRAIVTTDHGGNPCDYAAIESLAGWHGIPLIVDGAQSLGATFNGRPALSYGTVSTTSFHAAKLITTIEGGMVFTDDPALDRRLRIIRSQGEDPGRKYHHVELGRNFRMTELQAAIGLVQEKKLDFLLRERRGQAQNYRRLLAGLPGTPGRQNAGAGNFLFSCFVPDRDRVMQSLKTRGIQTRACYPIPLHKQPVFSHLPPAECPVAERACATILNPPMFSGLTRDQQSRVADELRGALGRRHRKAG
jgi:perosamine synthetase